MPGQVELDRAEFRRQVVALRRQSRGFRDIADSLGCSVSTAHEAWKAALAEVPAAEVVEARAEELQLILDGIAALMVIADDPDASNRARIDAWVAIRGFSEHRARLQGTFAPVRSQVQVLEPSRVDEEIERLLGQIAERAPTSERASG